MVETCCCGCFTVATGTAIIAVLDIIGAILQIIRNSVTVSFMLSSPEKIPEEQYPGFQNHPAGYIASLFFGIFIAVVYAGVSGLLFQGYRTRNVKLCTPWLYWNYIALGLLAISTIVLFIILTINGLFAVGLIYAIIMAIALAIATYFVLVVKRFMDGLRGGEYGAVNRNIN